MKAVSSLSKETADASNHPSDELIIEQQNMISADIARQSDLVTEVCPFDDLAESYNDEPIIAAKIQGLSERYTGYRKIRGDGNCFYRGYLLSIFEQFAMRADEPKVAVMLEKLVAKIDGSMAELVAQGFPQLIDDFWETFCEQLQILANKKPSSLEIENIFRDSSISDYLVMYGRFLTSGYLQQNADHFTPFMIDDVPNMQTFVRTEVEPMGREADNIQCIALASFLEIPLQIESVDKSQQSITRLNFPDDSVDGPFAFLLFRPGHYDVLQPRLEALDTPNS